MLQRRLVFSRQNFMSSPAPGMHPDRPPSGHLQSLQLRVGVVVIASLLVFGLVGVAPGSGYRTIQLVLTYNALILGYLSAFWGLWVADVPGGYMGIPYSARRIALAERDRLLWSLAPTVLGGCGMLLPLILPQDIGTLMLVTGFALLVTLEALGGRRGMPPAEFKPLRWSVSIAAMVILMNVLANQRWAFRVLF